MNGQVIQMERISFEEKIDFIYNKLKDSAPNMMVHKEQEKPMCLKDAAKFLGLHECTVRTKMKRGLPYHKRAGIYFFYQSELNNWIKTKIK
jgi:hypothetical protein